VVYPPMTAAAGQDAMLDFLICWHLASGAEGRSQVMAALRRRAAVPDRLGSGRRHGRSKRAGARWSRGLGWLRGRRPCAGVAAPPSCAP
jgi:hypothetical protein